MLIDVTMKTAEFDVWMRMLIYFGAAVSSSESCWGDDEQSSCLSFTAESSLTLLFYLWLGHNLDSEYRIDQNKLSVVIIKLRVFFLLTFSSYMHVCWYEKVENI